MDPNANLEEQLELARLLYPEREEDVITDSQTLIDNGARLAELVLALDEWINKGGFVPLRWASNRVKP